MDNTLFHALWCTCCIMYRLSSFYGPGYGGVEFLVTDPVGGKADPQSHSMLLDFSIPHTPDLRLDWSATSWDIRCTYNQKHSIETSLHIPISRSYRIEWVLIMYLCLSPLWDWITPKGGRLLTLQLLKSLWNKQHCFWLTYEADTPFKICVMRNCHYEYVCCITSIESRFPIKCARRVQGRNHRLFASCFFHSAVCCWHDGPWMIVLCFSICLLWHPSAFTFKCISSQGQCGNL